MRLVHAADIHLDSPLRGLARLEDDDLAQQLRQATRRALENLVELTISQRADALLLAGDIYDGDWRDYATGRFFADQMARLDDSGIPVFMVSGNHDAESEITRALTLPPNVTVFATDVPHTHTVDGLGLAVHGQSYPTRDVRHNLVQGYPDPVRGLVNVGLLHTAVDGAEGHAPYAPCTADDLARVGYEYFALGHVHAHRIVCGGEHVAAFSGNLQGRHPRETGPKGALVVDIAPGVPAIVRHEPLDVARWAVLTVDTGPAGFSAPAGFPAPAESSAPGGFPAADGSSAPAGLPARDGLPAPGGAPACRTLEDVLERASDQLRAARDAAGHRPVVARVEFVGASSAADALTDPERLREELGRIAAPLRIALQKITVRVTHPEPPASIDPDLIAAIEAASAGLRADTERLLGLAKPLDGEVGRLLRTADLLDLRNPETLADIANRAGAGLLARLAGETN